MRRDCPDGEMRDLLPDLVHETLSAGEYERVAAHVATCADCAAEVELIRSARLAFPAPAVDVSQVVAALPGSPVGAGASWGGDLGAWWGGGLGGRVLRVAAAIALVAIGGLSVVALWGLFDRGAGGAKTPVAAVAPRGAPGPDATPAARQVPVTPGGVAVASLSRSYELSFGGGLSDLTDDQLKTLLRQLDALEAALSTEPEVHATPIVPLREGGSNA